MPAPRRVFFDVTFTRTQSGSVGITRTVRRLGQELQAALPADCEFVPVAYHRSGYRQVADDLRERAGPPLASQATASLPARLLRAVSNSFLPRLVVRWAPLPLVKLAWRIYNGVIFDRLGRAGTPIAFREGDLLLLCDASWCCPAWRAADAARASGASVVVLLQDIFPLTYPQFSIPLMTAVFGHWLERIVGACDAIICNSRATETELRAYARARGWQLPAVGHFHLGADLARGAEPGSCREEIAAFLQSGRPCFSAIGTIEPRKNHAWLLQVFEGLWADGHDVALLVAGRTNAECRELAERMRTHPEQGRRLLTVFDATDAEVQRIYAQSRALVFPSLAEGFGLPLVEARAQGCPVIASDLPVFAEIADAGVFLYERSSPEALRALVLAHAAADHRQRVGTRPAFTWADSARQFLQAAQGLLRTGDGMRGASGTPGAAQIGSSEEKQRA